MTATDIIPVSNPAHAHSQKVAVIRVRGSFFHATLRKRFSNMRHGARYCNKYVPTYEELHGLFAQIIDMVCPACSRTMNLTDASGPRKLRMTLQHDHSGTLRMICFSCNAAHGQSKLGDAFFSIPAGSKYCARCETIKPVEDFWRLNSVRTSYHGRHAACKQCLSHSQAVYYAAHREEQRERCKVWRAANVDKCAADGKRYHAANRDAILAQNRRRYRQRSLEQVEADRLAGIAYRDANRKQESERKAAWYQNRKRKK